MANKRRAQAQTAQNPVTEAGIPLSQIQFVGFGPEIAKFVQDNLAPRIMDIVFGRSLPQSGSCLDEEIQNRNNVLPNTARPKLTLGSSSEADHLSLLLTGVEPGDEDMDRNYSWVSMHHWKRSNHWLRAQEKEITKSILYSLETFKSTGGILKPGTLALTYEHPPRRYVP